MLTSALLVNASGVFCYARIMGRNKLYLFEDLQPGMPVCILYDGREPNKMQRSLVGSLRYAVAKTGGVYRTRQDVYGVIVRRMR